MPLNEGAHLSSEGPGVHTPPRPPPHPMAWRKITHSGKVKLVSHSPRGRSRLNSHSQLCPDAGAHGSLKNPSAERTKVRGGFEPHRKVQIWDEKPEPT